MNHSVAAWFATQPSRLVEKNKVGVSLFLKVVGWSMGRETRNACSSASLLETNALLRINNQQQEFRSVVSSAQVCIFPQKSKKQYDLYIAAC